MRVRVCACVYTMYGKMYWEGCIFNNSIASLIKKYFLESLGEYDHQDKDRARWKSFPDSYTAKFYNKVVSSKNIQNVNFIKTRPLKYSRVFITLWNEMDDDRDNLV